MRIFFFSILMIFCYLGFAQTGTEILLFDLKTEDGQLILSNPVNITNHKGYDNQPFFHPKKPLVYYSSFDDSGRSDIKFYNYRNKKTQNLTLTPEREYSPTVTPDRKYISCIIQRDDGAQDLGKYPVQGGKPEVLINNLKVGYHAWLSNNSLLLFVLGDSANNNTLRSYSLLAKKDSIITVNIGRSLHQVPGTGYMSYVKNFTDNTRKIMRFNMETGISETITVTLPGQDHLTWLEKDIILMSDGKDIYSFTISAGTEGSWKQITIKNETSLLKGITRLSVNREKTKLAVVVSE